MSGNPIFPRRSAVGDRNSGERRAEAARLAQQDGPGRGNGPRTARVPRCGQILALVAIILLLSAGRVAADKTYTRNRKANRLYEQGKYEDALKIYEDALLEDPGDEKLKMNKGSAQYQLRQYDQAEQSLSGALTTKDKKALADLHYNLGNSLYRQGEQLMTGGGQGAQEKFKGALENYIKALDIRPDDVDTKWNLQLSQARLEQLKNQQQNQKDQNKDQNKDQDQNKDGQDKNRNQDNKDQQNKDQEDQKDQDQKKDQDQSRKDEEKKDDQRQRPQPQQEKEQEMKKDQARQLIEQFADDDDKLNKPQRVIKAREAKKPEKDW